MKRLSFICLLFIALFATPEAKADPVSGKYKVAVVIKSRPHINGLLGTLRISKGGNLTGSVYDYFNRERLPVRGTVQADKTIVFSPKPEGLTKIEAKILKRDKTVIGFKGSVITEDGASGAIRGYKSSSL